MHVEDGYGCTTIEAVYFGERQDMIAEVAAFDMSEFCDDAFYVLPVGLEGQYDTEAFATRKEAAEHAKYIAAQYPGAVVIAV